MMVSYNGLLLLLSVMSISNGALADDEVTCPMISDVSCPTMTSPGSDDVIQMVPKRLPRDHPLAYLEMGRVDLKLICAIPDCLSNPCLHGGTCQDTYDGYDCLCSNCTFGNHCEELFKDCSVIHATGQRTSGVFQICLVAEEPIDVFCNFDDYLGWLVFQRRLLDGLTNFNQNWTAYKNGFGDLNTEFWLGNDIIHRITSGQKAYRLRVDMEGLDDNLVHNAVYNNFRVASEDDGYRLNLRYDHISTFTGGDALSSHNGYQFSTPLYHDNDGADMNCAATYDAGWWFHDQCYGANLNGRSTPDIKQIMWNSFTLQAVEMKIRPML